MAQRVEVLPEVVTFAISRPLSQSKQVYSKFSSSRHYSLGITLDITSCEPNPVDHEACTAHVAV
jgi:hypothetical protein